MIPKVIHYCWFGGNPLPELAFKCIESWKKYCPEYEIREWNESNYDLNCCDYVREAYEAKKWAFVSDVARLDIIYQYGGIYLDTDVELLKPLDDFLTLPAFFGTESTGQLNTGLGFGAQPGNETVKAMREMYRDIHFIQEDQSYDLTACPVRNTEPLRAQGYAASDVIWKTGDAAVFPPQYFSPIDSRTGLLKVSEETCSIHHYSASWHTEEERYRLTMTKKVAQKCPFLSDAMGWRLAQLITNFKFRGIRGAAAATLAWLKKE